MALVVLGTVVGLVVVVVVGATAAGSSLRRLSCVADGQNGNDVPLKGQLQVLG